MTEQELNKACEWIANMPIEYSEFIDKGHCQWIAEDFRKAMGISGNNEEIPSKTCNPDKNLQELSWRDIKKIVNIASEFLDTSELQHGAPWGEGGYYAEVLRRFKEEIK